MSSALVAASLLPFLVTGRLDLGVVDRLALQPHVDDAVDVPPVRVVCFGISGAIAFTGAAGCWALANIALSTATAMPASQIVVVVMECSP